MLIRLPVFLLLLSLTAAGQDIDSVLEKADKILEEAKAGYEDAVAKSSPQAFVEAGFKLEEARIKYLVLQEIGSPEKQKVAADRLRAVNQLGKLIHDGRVAVSGTPAESPVKSPDAPAPAEAPAVRPLPAAADVTKRAAVPDAAKQKESEKTIRDLFKEQYAKKVAADRKALARLLLDQAVQIKDDPTSLWVLYRDALDAAVQGGDQRIAFEVIDAMARSFDIDPLALKNSSLATLAKSVKTLEESAAIADGQLRLVDEYFAVDQFDLADRACALAIQLAKRSTDAALATRATARAKEVTEAKSKFGSLKRVLETLAKNPADPQANHEMGQFLCFVKGNWDLGICFLAKGSDGVLKPLADKELAFPTAVADRVALADGWWELAQKESSPLRKNQLLAHAGALYEAAAPEATGLLKIRITKRLEGYVKPGAPAQPQLLGPTVDLLKMIDPKKDSVSGEWKLEKDALVMPAGTQTAWLQIPYQPPDEYDLRVVAARRSGNLDLFLGLIGGGRPMLLHIDGSGAGNKMGIGTIDGKNWEANELVVPNAKQFVDDKPHTVMVSVRKNNLTVSVDGKLLLNWKSADYTKLSAELNVPNTKALYLGNWETVYEITSIQLATVSGTGKKVAHVR